MFCFSVIIPREQAHRHTFLTYFISIGVLGPGFSKDVNRLGKAPEWMYGRIWGATGMEWTVYEMKIYFATSRAEQALRT